MSGGREDVWQLLWENYGGGGSDMEEEEEQMDSTQEAGGWRREERLPWKEACNLHSIGS